MEENRKDATAARHRFRAIKVEKERLNCLLEHYSLFPLSNTQNGEESTSAYNEQRYVKHADKDG